jgi:hypothetical protein
MSERGVVRVRGTGAPHVLFLRGVTEEFTRPSRITVRAGDRVLGEESVGSSFSLRFPVPGELLPRSESLITIETDQVYVPAERDSSTQDRRRLGLKVLESRLEPGSASQSASKTE